MFYLVPVLAASCVEGDDARVLAALHKHLATEVEHILDFLPARHQDQRQRLEPGTKEGNGLFNDALNTLYLRLYGIRHTVKERKGNVLFNDALNTLYLRLYGVRHMVKDHSDSKRGNWLPPHGVLFLISSKGSFICNTPTDRITHTMAFVTPVVEHWQERWLKQRYSIQYIALSLTSWFQV